MRRYLTLSFVSSLLFTMPAYANNQNNTNPYLQRMQQAFTQANAQSKMQFDKAHPKPVAPALPTPSAGGIMSPNMSSQTTTSSNYPSSALKTKPNIAASTTSSYQDNQLPPARSPASNIAVGGNLTDRQNDKKSYNIFVPPGNNTQQETAQSNGTTNIYR